MTNTDTVFELIARHPEGLDDDELSRTTGVEPRQQIHQICTRLAGEGRISRISVQKPGKRRKIHNFPYRAIPSSATDALGMNDKKPWRRKLAMLEAATGQPADQLLDRAVGELAKRLIAEEYNQFR